MPEAGGVPPAQTHRPKVWLLADRRGQSCGDLAYDELCRGIASAVAAEFETRIAYANEQPDLSSWHFDLVLVCSATETWHQQFVPNADCVVKLIDPEAWRDAQDGKPNVFFEQHLGDTGTLAATSHRLLESISPHRDALLACEGVDCVRFASSQDQTLRDASVPVRFGWADHANGPDETERSLLEAATGDLDLRFAPRNPTPGQLERFYRDLDVAVITSSQEGQLRPLLRGMASGCFAISTNVGIATDLIRNADNGLIVERTASALGTAMQWCQANPQYVRRRGAQSAVAMRQERSWEAVAPQWLRLLRAARQRQAGLPTSPQDDSALARNTHPGAVLTPTRGHVPAPHSPPPAPPSSAPAVDDPPRDATCTQQAYYRCELLPILPDDWHAQVLDVGCAHGSLLDFLHGQGYRHLAGVDNDDARHRHAQSRLHDRARIHHAEANAWLADHRDRFDFVSAYDLIENFAVEAAIGLAERIRQSLRPGGLAVFRTPNMANVLGGYARFCDLKHRSGFTEQSAMQLLHAAGFVDIQLVLPDFANEPHLHAGVIENRKFHEHLFAVQDREKPLCFDKNLIVTGKRAGAEEPLRAKRAYASVEA